ncbi:hypothetical protein G9A89_012443 [Geosiphon pyriformis]|nr:hypothetical protein G9A89_012443 [Geosiphon pyriformis]
MTSIEDIKHELEYVKTQYRRCIEKLEEFKEEAWIEEKEDLEKQKEKLEIEKNK